MSEFFHTTHGRRIEFQKFHKQGGEGVIYEAVNDSNLLAKKYHADVLAKNRDLPGKIAYMVTLSQQMDKSLLANLAWPKEVLFDSNTKFVGFTMGVLEECDQLSNTPCWRSIIRRLERTRR